MNEVCGVVQWESDTLFVSRATIVELFLSGATCLFWDEIRRDFGLLDWYHTMKYKRQQARLNWRCGSLNLIKWTQLIPLTALHTRLTCQCQSRIQYCSILIILVMSNNVCLLHVYLLS